MTSLHTAQHLKVSAASVGVLLLSLVCAGATVAQTVPASALASDTASATPLCRSVEVRNVRPGRGLVLASAFLSAADFVAKRPASAASLPAGSTDSVTLQLCGLSGEQMSVTVMQDFNGNGVVDRNMMGMPIEPWAASGTPPAMSAPTFETTQVPVGTTPLVVQLSK